MSKRLINFLVAAVVLVVLIGTYVYMNRPVDDSTDDTTQEPVSETTLLVEGTSTNITSYSLKGADYSFTFERDGDIWNMPGNDTIELDSAAITGVTYYIANLSSKATIEKEPADLAQYGLAAPVVTIEAAFDDGTNTKLYLGNLAATGDAYYLMREGDPSVYIVSSYVGENYLMTLSDFRPRALPSINEEKTISGFYVKARDRDALRVEPSPDDSLLDYGISAYIVTEPYDRGFGAATVFVTEYVNGFAELSIKDFIDDDPSDLSVYGLDDPSLVLEIATDPDPETEEVIALNLVFGDDTGDNEVYFKHADKPNVYTMDKALVQQYFDYSPFKIIDKFIALVNITSIDTITVATTDANNQSSEYVMTIERTNITNEEGEEEVLEKFFNNGREVEDTAFKAVYQRIIGIMADSELPEAQKPATGSPGTITITYHSTENQTDRVVNLRPHNSDFYAAGVDGEYPFVVSVRPIESMLQLLGDL